MGLFDSFINFLGGIPNTIERDTPHFLNVSGALMEQKAKEYIGEYQPAVGNLPAWAPLADSTVAEKSRLGYAEDPLLRTGEVRDSITMKTDQHGVTVGSDNPVAAMLEHGTSKMPPRSFLERAVLQSEKDIENEAKRLLEIAFLGRR